jgi:hypothetical protein
MTDPTYAESLIGYLANGGEVCLRRYYAPGDATDALSRVLCWINNGDAMVDGWLLIGASLRDDEGCDRVW